MGLSSSSPENPKYVTTARFVRAVTETIHAEGRKSMRGCGIVAIVWLLGVVAVFVLRDTWNAKDGFWPVFNVINGVFLSVVGPAIAVIYGIKVISYLNWRKKKGLGGMAWRLFIGFWLLVGGVIIMAIAADNAYHAAKGMAESPGLRKVIAGIIILLVCIGVRQLGLSIMKQAFSTKTSYSEEKDLAAADALRHAWAQLDFASLEQQLATPTPLPSAYKAMLQPGSEWREKQWTLYPKGLDDEDGDIHDVYGVEPPHAGALRKHPETGETLLCFAWAEYSEYWLRPGSEDPPVYLFFKDSGPDVIEEIAPRLSVFLGWEKKEW